MGEHSQPAPPTNLSGYLEALARVMFSSGISWRVVEAKWAGISDAFSGFDLDRLASMGTRDVDRLMEDTRVIRNRRKLEGVITNAGRLAEDAAEHGGYDRYLDSLGDYDATKTALRKRYAFIGDSGAPIFLWMVGRPVPGHHPW